jgi:hypothetical protein
VTSQKDIQSLLDDIEGILPKAEARLPWSQPGEVASVRRVLVRVRSFLISRQKNLAASSEKPLPRTPQQEIVQQLMQAVAQDMNLLRAEVIRPLQADVEALKRERDSLAREIKQLESKKQQIEASTQLHVLQQQVISEFSVGLISRCSDSLTQQLAQTLVNLEAHLLSSTPTPVASTQRKSHLEAVPNLLPPHERVEQLRQLQAQSDELMVTLDANQRAIFEALQRNLQSYQESLSLGLEKMHRLGLQGEMLFTAFVNSLAQQLGLQASTILPSGHSVSESATSTNPAISGTKPETLLPSGVLKATELFSSGNLPVTGIQIPLPLVEPISGPTVEHTFPEHHLSQDWEIIEGLDLDTPASVSDVNQEIDTFIQLNVDTPGLLPTLEEVEFTEDVFSQDQDDLLAWANEQLTTTTPESQTTELLELKTLDIASEVNSIADNRREEIEDLYESIFGKDSSLDTPITSELDQIAPPTLSSAFLTQWDEQFSHIESSSTDQIPSSSHYEEALFEGLEDPAFEIIDTQELDNSATELPSWEDLFIENSGTLTPLAGDELGKQVSQQETIKTIAALTELCDEMNLSYNSLTIANNSIPATTIPELESPISNTEPQISLLEEQLEEYYITASPDEDLLTIQESETNSELEILLDQNTLQQLSEDLDSFEDIHHQIVPRKHTDKTLDKYASSANIFPEAERINSQNHWLLRSDELLAEDWEEFGFNDLYDEDFSALAPVNSPTEESSLTPEEIVELDFDPHLFPSERLELDQENTRKLTLPDPKDLSVKAELVAPEDEAFIEMQWDEPIDSITEEKIASSELSSNADSLSPPTNSKNQQAPKKKIIDDSKG